MRILKCFGAMLLGAAICAAQTTSPPRSGFVVITPGSQLPGGVLVTETLRINSGGSITQSLIEATPLVTSTAFPMNSASPVEDTAVAAVNPGNSATTLTFLLRDSAGNITHCKSFVLGARTQIAQFAAELFAVSGTTFGTRSGLMTMNSTTPVGVIGLQFRGASFSTIPMANPPSDATLAPSSCTGLPGGNIFNPVEIAPPSSAPLLNASGGLFPVPTMASGVGGTGSILLPQFVHGGGWDSTIVISNITSLPQVVRVDVFASDGSSTLNVALGNIVSNTFTNISIPAGGFVTMVSAN